MNAGHDFKEQENCHAPEPIGTIFDQLAINLAYLEYFNRERLPPASHNINEYAVSL